MVPPVSTPRRYHRLNPAERRDQILDAANELFAERGYDEVTIEDVAKSAGVARGLVHHYFGGRKEVFIALVGGLAGFARMGCGPPSVAALAPEWRTRCHAGSTEPKRTEPSTSARSHRVRTSPTQTVRRVVTELVHDESRRLARGVPGRAI